MNSTGKWTSIDLYGSPFRRQAGGQTVQADLMKFSLCPALLSSAVPGSQGKP